MSLFITNFGAKSDINLIIKYKKMKKFLLTLAAVMFATSALMAQTPATNPTPEEPDRVQMKALSKNPTGMDIPTGIDKAQVVDRKHECKDHKDGQPCTKPADQQCPDCKAKAANAPKHECKEGMKKCDKAEGMKHECKEGMKKCEKAEGMKHECKEGMKKCEKAEGMKRECKEGMKKCDKAAADKKDCCKDKKMEGKKCDKPADQQCPDCKEKAKKN